jgi:hypothetical protein
MGLKVVARKVAKPQPKPKRRVLDAKQAPVAPIRLDSQAEEDAKVLIKAEEIKKDSTRHQKEKAAARKKGAEV